MWTAGQPHQPPGPHTYPGAAGPYPTAQPRSPYPGGPAPAGGNPATAVISAILALLVTVHHGILLFMDIASGALVAVLSLRYGPLPALIELVTIVDLLMLGLGAVLMLARVGAGRVMVVIGGVGTLVHPVVAYVWTLFVNWLFIIAALVALTALLLALLPETGRYLKGRHTATAGHPGVPGYPGAPGYPGVPTAPGGPGWGSGASAPPGMPPSNRW